MDEYQECIERLIKVITELDSRNYSGNCGELVEKTWLELCDEGIDLFERLKK